ncbi:P2Y purinoceptor 14 [Python bivittatus]|uniref:P2Y purinoceptor 14 n=1 Tax=Python bivittatus TaxID=176946 RepID=A0A9F3W2H0_PYTBI|nr:P2Y purinoceptor 14 [Python bivittatus]
MTSCSISQLVAANSTTLGFLNQSLWELLDTLFRHGFESISSLLNHLKNYQTLCTGTDNELNMLSSSNTSENNCIYNKIITQQVLPLTYGFIFIGGILLNGAAAWVFLHIPSKTSFIVYLKNIVIADLIMSLTYPFKIFSDSKIGPWQLNVVVCRFSAVIFYLNMYISIMLFGLIGFDRCFKVVKPQSITSTYGVQCSKIICVVIWMLQILISFPNVILTNQTPTKNNSNNCMDLKSPLGFLWHTASSYTCLGIFWIVFFLLIVFYSSIAKKIYISHQKFKKNSTLAKKKTNRNIFTIMLVFILCFVPYHIVRFPYTLSQTTPGYNCKLKEVLFYIKELALLLSAANVCLDPIIYVFLCQPFKEKLYQKLHLKVKTSEEFENSRSRKSNAICETVIVL